MILDRQSRLEETLSLIQSASDIKPRLALVLGSGLGGFVDYINTERKIQFSEIPHFKPVSVKGHKGQLIFGEIHDLPIVILQGRIHFYEYHQMEPVIYPIHTLHSLGIKTLILTNSAGGLNPNMKPGDLMVIEDHINLMGVNPLKGSDLNNRGDAFPDMTEAYNKDLKEEMMKILNQFNIPYSKGVYCGVSGPSYETPAEIRFLQKIGVQAVGMSTVPESIVANHLGMKVCGLSCITNLAAGLSGKKLNHREVIETANSFGYKFHDFLSQLLANLKKTDRF